MARKLRFTYLTRILEIYVNFMRRSLVTADPRIA